VNDCDVLASSSTLLFGRSVRDDTPATRLISVCLEEVSAGVLATLIAQRDQPPQVDRDVAGLAVVCILYLF
jgi:hypothetical protein